MPTSPTRCPRPQRSRWSPTSRLASRSRRHVRYTRRSISTMWQGSRIISAGAVSRARACRMVIQAGGESRRMGRSKATVPFCGRPLICRLGRAALAGGRRAHHHHQRAGRSLRFCMRAVSRNLRIQLRSATSSTSVARCRALYTALRCGPQPLSWRLWLATWCSHRRRSWSPKRSR